MSLEELLSRDELAAILFAVHDINMKLTLIIDLLEGGANGEEWSPEKMAKSGRRKTTPEQRAEWKRNEDRLRDVLERRLAKDGLTREEVERRAFESARKTLEG